MSSEVLEPSSVQACAPPRLSLATLFAKFLRFGFAAFGGPVAQIAMLRAALVEREAWVSPARFNRLLAVMQALPGPEAHELCVHLGMVARGRAGGIVAGLGFMLPGFVLMLLAGWAYTTWVAGARDVAAALIGVQVVILAVILRAVIRIGGHVIEDRLGIALAAASLVATMAGVPFWLPLVASGLAYALAGRPWLSALVLGVAAMVGLLLLPGTLSVAPAVGAAVPVTLAALFVAGLKGGLLTFGGAYTAIPYIRDDTVGRGWISDATFLDGVAIAGVLPAPLVIFATFVGYVAGGPGGAVAITAGMFLPAFAFSLILFERLELLVEAPGLHRLLAGVAVAVVGIIAATFVQLAGATLARVPHPAAALILFSVALVMVWRVKSAWVTPALIAVGGVAGWSGALA